MPAKPQNTNGPKWPKKGTYTGKGGEAHPTIERGMESVLTWRIPVVDESGKVGELIGKAKLPPEDYSWAWMESWCFDNITPGKPCGINEWLASVIKKLGSDTSDEMKDTAREAVSWCKQTLEALAKNDAPMAANLAFKAGLAVQEYIMRRRFELDVRRSKSSIEAARGPRARGSKDELVIHVQTRLPGWKSMAPKKIRLWLVEQKVLKANETDRWEAVRKALASVKARPKKPAT